MKNSQNEDAGLTNKKEQPKSGKLALPETSNQLKNKPDSREVSRGGMDKALNKDKVVNKSKVVKKPVGRAAKRQKARFFLVQAMYQFQLAKTPVHEIIAQFQVEHDESSADWPFFSAALQYTINHLDEVDDIYQSFLDRHVSQVDPIEKAILRLGAYELSQREDIPYRVSINEAVELAKTFGATDSHRYINGVMDKVSKQLRSLERV